MILGVVVSIFNGATRKAGGSAPAGWVLGGSQPTVESTLSCWAMTGPGCFCPALSYAHGYV